MAEATLHRKNVKKNKNKNVHSVSNETNKTYVDHVNMNIKFLNTESKLSDMKNKDNLVSTDAVAKIAVDHENLCDDLGCASNSIPLITVCHLQLEDIVECPNEIINLENKVGEDNLVSTDAIAKITVDHENLCDDLECTSNSVPLTTVCHLQLEDIVECPIEIINLENKVSEEKLIDNLDCSKIIDAVEKTNVHHNDSTISQFGNNLEMINALEIVEDFPITEPVNTNLIAADAIKESSSNMNATAPIEQFDVQVLSEKQIHAFYYNEVLESTDHSTNDFMQQANPMRHELLDLLNAYTRSKQRLQLSQSTADAKYSAVKHHSNNAWRIEKQSGTATGRCQDNVVVSGSYDFEVATFDETSCSKLNNTLRDLRDEISEEMALQAYTVLIARLQVEAYFHELLSTNPLMRFVVSMDPVRISLSNGGPNEQMQLHRLRDALSILFCFLRKPLFMYDAEVRQDLRMWTERLTAVLLRIGQVFDHLFLMHHLLRCPPGLSAEWASSLLQFSLQSPDLHTLRTNGDNNSFQNVEFDYMIACLALLLRPVLQRETFLMALRQLSTPLSFTDKIEQDLDRKWVLIDSEGEEDEDPEQSWHRFQENDLMALLNQFPLDILFQKILRVGVDNGVPFYDPSTTKFSGMMRLLAFAHCLLRLLSDGLKHFNLGRYRQLNKRLGRLIRMLSQFITDHWWNVRTCLVRLGHNTKDVMQLQIQYELFMQSSCVALLGANRLGSWQYLVNIPFDLLGSHCKRLVARLLFVDGSAASSSSMDDLACMKSEICMSDLHVLEARLPSMAPAESIYLLSTAAGLARACQPGICSTDDSLQQDDTVLLNLLVALLFRLSYVCEETRDACAKVGRELLSSVAFRHPPVLGTLLGLAAQEIESAGSMLLYLFRDLPLHLMILGEAELLLVEQWLLNTAVASVTHQLGRVILAGFNWEEDVHFTTHRRVALLLAASSQKLLKEHERTALLSPPRGLISGWFAVSGTPEQQAWQSYVAIALRLRLHQSRWTANWSPEEACVDPRQVDLAGRLDHRHVVEGAAQKNPLTSYLVLCLSRVGHEVELFATQGIALLQGMLESKGGAPLALEAVAQCLPLFGSSQQQQYLLTDSFSALISSILKADVNSKEMTSKSQKVPTDKMDEDTSWLSTCIGAVMALIEDPVFCSTFALHPATDSMLAFWLRLLTRFADWQSDAFTLELLDQLLEKDFSHWSAGGAGAGQLGLQVLSDAHVAHLRNSNANSASGPRALFGIIHWLASGSTWSSLLDALSSVRTVHNNPLGWLRWQICCAEAFWEDKCGLWFEVNNRLIMEPSLEAEQAVRVVGNALKLAQVPTLAQLSVIRAVHQLHLLPATHPVLPLLCQFFFRRFLGRSLAYKDSQVVGGVGERFFSAAPQRSALKKLRAHLRDASVYWRKCGEEAHADPSYEGHCARLSSAFEAFALWCDEPRLHHAGLHLLSLPVEYEPARLTSLVEKVEDAVWIDLVRMGSNSHALHWKQRHRLESSLKQLGQFQKHLENTCATRRLLDRLSRLTSDCKARLAAPQVAQLQPPLTEVDLAALGDYRLLQNALHESVSTLADFARHFSERMSRLMALDIDYTESLLPQLYSNQTTRTTLTLACPSALQMSALRPVRRCKGEAVIAVEYQALQRNDAVYARLNENRTEANQLLQTGRNAPPLALICSIARVERAITTLVRFQQQQQHASFAQSGAELFFSLIASINIHTRFYPPSRHFMSTAIEVLGQKFVQSNGEYAIRIVKAVFADPERVDFLAPNFNPASVVSSATFLQLYRHLVAAAADPQSISPKSAPVLFSLFSKFDLSSWLQLAADADRSTLISVVAEALSQCGPEPDQELLLLFELHRRHMRTLLRFNLAAHLFPVLRSFMPPSSNERLASSCWSDVLLTLTDADDLDMSTEELTTIICWFSSDLWQHRQALPNGLYPRWRRYLPDLARIGARLLRVLVTKTIRSIAHGHQSLSSGVAFLWKAVVDLFGPWLAVNLQANDAKSAQSIVSIQAWTVDNGPDASSVLVEFVDLMQHIECICDKELNTEGSLFLPLMWHWYQTSLAPVDCSAGTVLLLHSHLEKLDWHAFRPDPHLMAGMLHFYTICASPSRAFLASLLGQVLWTSWLNKCQQDILVSLVPQLFHAIVVMCANVELLCRQDVQQLMTSLTCHTCWRHLTTQQYESSVQWLSSYCEPREMLFERSSPQHHLLRFLQSAVGFEGCAVGDFDDSRCQALQDLSMGKQVAFVRFNVQMLCRATGASGKAVEIDAHRIHMPVVNLLTDVEAALQKVPNTERRNMHGLTLAQESLHLLRNCTPARLRLFLDTFAGWCRDSGGSPLLLPLMRSVVSQPPNLQVCVVLMESILQAYLNDEGRGGWDSWTCVLVAMDISCSQTGLLANAMLDADALRSLHLLLLKELQRCRSAQDEAAVAGRASDWLLRSKVRVVNAEVGFILLLDKTLELITRLTEVDSGSGGYGGALRFLTDFVIPALEPLAADKIGGGVLGLIGLGKSSVLSVRFRLICRSVLGHLYSQMPSNGSLRLLPDAPGYLTTAKRSTPGFVAPNIKAEQILNQLGKLKNNSQYGEHSSLLDFVCAFMCDPQRCLSSSRILIGTLCSQLYTNERCLAVLVSSAQTK